MNARLVVLALSTLLASGGVSAQSPTPPQQPVAETPRLESRGASEQQLIEWQRQRAEEYYRRMREYLATIGRIA